MSKGKCLTVWFQKTHKCPNCKDGFFDTSNNFLYQGIPWLSKFLSVFRALWQRYFRKPDYLVMLGLASFKPKIIGVSSDLCKNSIHVIITERVKSSKKTSVFEGISKFENSYRFFARLWQRYFRQPDYLEKKTGRAASLEQNWEI